MLKLCNDDLASDDSEHLTVLVWSPALTVIRALKRAKSLDIFQLPPFAIRPLSTIRLSVHISPYCIARPKKVFLTKCNSEKSNKNLGAEYFSDFSVKMLLVRRESTEYRGRTNGDTEDELKRVWHTPTLIHLGFGRCHSVSVL